MYEYTVHLRCNPHGAESNQRTPAVSHFGMCPHSHTCRVWGWDVISKLLMWSLQLHVLWFSLQSEAGECRQAGSLRDTPDTFNNTGGHYVGSKGAEVVGFNQLFKHYGSLTTELKVEFPQLIDWCFHTKSAWTSGSFLRSCRVVPQIS